MMTDIRNLQAFALYMQKTDIKFDLFSVTKEMDKQVYLVLKYLFAKILLDLCKCFIYMPVFQNTFMLTRSWNELNSLYGDPHKTF